jgi:hypothetical protein
MTFIGNAVRRPLAAAVGATALLSLSAHANIDLELRLESNNPQVGDVIEIGLYAVSDQEANQELRGIEAVFAWNPAVLEFLQHVDPQTYVWSVIGFPDPFGVNEADPPADGDGLYSMIQFPSGINATPGGVLVTTFEFEVLQEAVTSVSIQSDAINGGTASTCVFDPVLPNTCITGELGVLQVTIGNPCAGNPTDSDGDGFPDICDNCPGIVNPGQGDSDSDGVGDLCDNCPDAPNDGQIDTDLDGVGDACDECAGGDDSVDTDMDGVPDACDNCPDDANNSQADDDGDGVGNACDVCGGADDNLDSDFDGIPDGCDECPFDAGNDSDGDGVCDTFDACPGFDDNLDADNDTLPDGCDDCPLDPLNDADEDGFCGDEDNCPDTPNADQADNDDDGFGNACEPCASDVDNSGETDVDDLIAIIAGWGSDGLFNNSDVNFDGIVDVDDLLEVIFAWGECD